METFFCTVTREGNCAPWLRAFRLAAEAVNGVGGVPSIRSGGSKCGVVSQQGTPRDVYGLDAEMCALRRNAVGAC